MSVDFCEDEECILDFINEAEEYFVLFKNYRWDGSSGAGFFTREKLQEACIPVFLSSCEFKNTTGKILTLAGYHHDKPTGFLAYAVALTKKEFAKMQKAEDFWELEEMFEELLQN